MSVVPCFPSLRHHFIKSPFWSKKNKDEAPREGQFNIKMNSCRSPSGSCKPFFIPPLEVNLLPRDEGPPSESILKRQKFAIFEKQCSKIAEGLYVSGESVAKSREILQEHGITHVVNCVGAMYQEYFKDDGVRYRTMFLQGRPADNSNISPA
jgi:hypothetical protein